MRIFILEDDPDRIRQFCHWFGSGYESPPSPIKWHCIQTNVRLYDYHPPYDIMFLDHDLGGRQMQSHEDDGKMFVRDILGTNLNPETEVILHSHNPDGAKEMFNLLKESGHKWHMIAPFGYPSFLSLIKVIQDKAKKEAML